MATQLRGFTSKGGTFPLRGVFRVGTLGDDPKPIRARLSNQGFLRGSNVRVINPAALKPDPSVRRTRLGMGGV